MACQYCYHSKENKDHLPFTKGVMKRETAFRIIDQAAELGVNSIKMNYRGESTINPHFRDITFYAKSKARGSTFIDRLTNSNFKFRTDRDDIFDGLMNQTKVKVSYDSFRKEVFETQRAGGDHDLTTRNIDKFHSLILARGSGPELVIQAVRTQLNKDEDIAGQAAARWPLAKISIRDMVAGRLEKDVSDMEVRHRDVANRQSCEQAHVRLMFDYQGTAGACCPDIGSKIRLGNIHLMHMRDIFNSQVAKELRRDLKSGKAFESDPCKGCSSHESYRGFKPVWNS